MIRVVLDTNILISGILSAKGAPARILRLEREGKFDLLFSPPTVSELWRVLHYPRITKRLARLGIPLETAERFFQNLVKASLVTPGEKEVDAIKADPSDNIFLACAVEGQAHFIVSGDRHLKSLGTFQSIRIVDPVAFLSVIEPHEA